jgi:hypothetical protein
MSWSDPARRFEPAEDAALRGELRELFGMSPEITQSVVASSAPQLTDLADDLRREALRRRRTERRKPSWMLFAAAGLPLALALGGTGVWGMQQKRRADTLAENVRQREAEMQRIALVSDEAIQRERRAREEVQQQLQLASQRQTPGKRPYLVIPAERRVEVPTLQPPMQVKNPPQ